MGENMVITALILGATAALIWVALRNCPLARAIARQARQVAASR